MRQQGNGNDDIESNSHHNSQQQKKQSGKTKQFGVGDNSAERNPLILVEKQHDVVQRHQDTQGILCDAAIGYVPGDDSDLATNEQQHQEEGMEIADEFLKDSLIPKSNDTNDEYTIPSSLEIEGGGGSENLVDDDGTEYTFNNNNQHMSTRVTRPWFSLFVLSVVCSFPTLLIFMILVYNIVGRMWAMVPFCAHCLLISMAGIASLPLSPPSQYHPSQLKASKWKACCLSALTSLSSLVDIGFFGGVYPVMFNQLDRISLTECDGSSVPEYIHYRVCIRVAIGLGYFIAAIRLLLGVLYSTNWFLRSRWKYSVGFMPRQNHTMLQAQRIVRLVWIMLAVAASFFLAWSVYSAMEYLFGVPSPPLHVQRGGTDCDPLDETECMLPFPSYYYMVQDKVSATGYRVNLLPHVIPPMKGWNAFVHPYFLNKLDGFPTMGPFMFYIDGLKEAHEQTEKVTNNDNNNMQPHRTKLMGPPDIAKSVTSESMTLLIDVDDQVLVPHSAEIDYLAPDDPLVLVFPAQPCKHNTHYALAVVNASNVSGERFPPTPGLKALLSDSDNGGRGDDDKHDDDRRRRFKEVVIPALEKAAAWFSFAHDPGSLQLLFDFPTISEESQLGPIRTVRNATMKIINDNEWKWYEHARQNSVQDFDCSNNNETHYARIINAEIDVPWFLDGFGIGHRAAFLDDHAVNSGILTTMGFAKLRIHVPCSVWPSTISTTGGETNGQSQPARDISAVLEHGHGLFYDRNEASFQHVQLLADQEAYLVISMDWRGMSAYDLLFVLKALVAKPSLLQALRDNLIQGYACKLAMLHFSRNGLWSTDWLSFEDKGGTIHEPTVVSNPTYAFYGNSQGGILGAGYIALSGTTNLIDRAVLGVPGTPFALVMTRSLVFKDYDNLLLLNFHNNRHVRMLIAIIQMAWDSTEGSGFLALPIQEPYPPVLMQAGLGDSTVPTNAAEALARGFRANLLPHHPRDIFGLSVAQEQTNGTLSSDAIFTELLFQKEYQQLPKDDIFGAETSVHNCLRQDEAVNRQIAHFVTNQEILDICRDDNCVRPSVQCWP